MLGNTLGHYRIIEHIGSGGMGVVYRAHDEKLDRDVALKVLPPGTLADESVRKKFRKEALALAQLNHPNIETIFESADQDGVDFLVMELIPGRALNYKIKEGPLPLPEVARLGIQLADGLAAAHDRGIIHCDLKPHNLILTPDGRLKILDFGLARRIHPIVTGDIAGDVTRSITVETGPISGTVPYMSPEQLTGHATDARSDIFSAGKSPRSWARSCIKNRSRPFLSIRGFRRGLTRCCARRSTKPPRNATRPPVSFASR